MLTGKLLTTLNRSTGRPRRFLRSLLSELEHPITQERAPHHAVVTWKETGRGFSLVGAAPDGLALLVEEMGFCNNIAIEAENESFPRWFK